MSPEDKIIVDEIDLVAPDHYALYQHAKVDPFASQKHDWHQIQENMLTLMRHKMGIGLASNQVGNDYNMFVMDHSDLGGVGVFNPEILDADGEAIMEEGCLTWPLLYLRIARAENIKVRFSDADGIVTETWMKGLDSRCFQHEFDHLRGVNFFDHVSEFKLKRAKEKRDKLLKKLDRIHA